MNHRKDTTCLDCNISIPYVSFVCRLLKLSIGILFIVAFSFFVIHRLEEFKRCQWNFDEKPGKSLGYPKRQYVAGDNALHNRHEDFKENTKENIKEIKVDINDIKERFLMSSAFEVSGLGNLMFQYAALIGISKHYDMDPVIPSNLPLLEYFSLSATKANATRPGEKWGKIISNKASAFQERVLNIKTIDQNLEIVGFFQSWKYFERADAEVKEEFRFRDDIERSAERFIQTAVNNYTKTYNISSPTLIGLHIRRGDMTSSRFHEIGYVTVDTSYIRAAMNYMSRKFTNILYIVCSDDLPWAQENIKVKVDENSTMVHFCPSRDPATDLAILTQTDHLIMSTGTFSWWAGWLSRGEVVYYKHFPRGNSSLSRMFSKDRMDYYCPSWTPL